jgi:shikimate kinase
MSTHKRRLIFLCGMMGSGKSTVGRILANKLDIPFIDVDEEIEKSSKMKISEIFAGKGEKSFRKIEREHVFKAAASDEGVVALGGGALQNQKIIDYLKLKGLLIFLDASLSVLLNRVKNDNTRPILQNTDGSETADRLKKLLQERGDFYRQSQITVDAGSEPSDAVADTILKKIEMYET